MLLQICCRSPDPNRHYRGNYDLYSIYKKKKRVGYNAHACILCSNICSMISFIVFSMIIASSPVSRDLHQNCYNSMSPYYNEPKLIQWINYSERPPPTYEGSQTINARVFYNGL